MNPYLDRDRPALYFIVTGSFVKVGLSMNPWRRSGEVLVDSSAKPLEVRRHDRTYLLGYIERCDRFDERAVHALLAEHHVCGEWFRAGPATDEALNTYAPRGGDFGRSRWYSAADLGVIEAEAAEHDRAAVKVVGDIMRSAVGQAVAS